MSPKLVRSPQIEAKLVLENSKLKWFPHYDNWTQGIRNAKSSRLGAGAPALRSSEKTYLHKAPAIQINPPDKREII